MEEVKKKHRTPKVGAKAEKKKAKKQDKRNPATVDNAKARNPKAFSFNSVDKAMKRERRSLDTGVRRSRLPMKVRTATPSTISDKIPPVIISVVGPPKVGKTTLIQSLIRFYSRHTIADPTGPITVISGKKRRLTFMECQNDLNSMIDCAKISDLVLLVIDGHFGFEMETFEFLNVLQVHGFPKVMGILTHLDKFRTGKQIRNAKKTLKHRFSAEVYPGAKLYYFSGLVNERYPYTETHNLARFISVMKFKPLKWQNSHPYLLADRMEDITHPQKVKDDPTTDRTIVVCGYVRGTPLKSSTKVHIPGCDDFWLDDITELTDPCPLPDSSAVRRSLSEKQRHLYAPFSNIANIELDKDATYIDIPEHKMVFTKKDGEEIEDDEELAVGEKMVRNLQSQEQTVDEKLDQSHISLFSHSAPIMSRERRPMSFSDELEPNSTVDNSDDDADDSDDSDDDIDMENVEIPSFVKRHSNMEQSSDEESSEEFFDSKKANSSEASTSWFDNVSKLYKGKGKSLMEIVYGERAIASNNDSDNEDDGELLRLVQDKQKEKYDEIDRIDSALFNPSKEEWTSWSDDSDALEKLKERFSEVTWFEDVDDDLLRSDEELYGDFEDLEAEGEEKEEVDNKNSDHESESDEETEKMKLLKKKEALKAKFNSEYDETDDGGYLEDYKEKIEQQEQLNKQEFASEDPVLRAQLLGHECGSYIRIQISRIPCEFVEHFNPKVPLVIGGLLPSEHGLGFVQTRVKRHRWHRKILKNNDPIIVSLGWRRFQTMPLYSLADDSLRHRMLKYTPEHMHCYATFYGPVTPPNTAFIAFQHLQNNVSTFRVALTGVILEVDQSFQIVKKLKLTGTPFKTFKNTAFIRGMFNSELEVAKFQGAAIRTVSGIRGQIKKPLKSPGTYRATFEDKILMSDIVFLRTWYPVHPQKFYNPVSSLLDSEWRGMKTVFQLRKERKMKIPVNKDSLYKPIERTNRKFNPLRIPKSLEKELPFALKPKRMEEEEKLERPVLIGYENKEEKKVDHLLQQLGVLKEEKIRKQKEKREENFVKRQKVIAAETAKAEARAKISRKRIYKMQGIEKEKAAKRRKFSHTD